MRISDWSSDVCSSDLVAATRRIGNDQFDVLVVIVVALAGCRHGADCDCSRCGQKRGPKPAAWIAHTVFLPNMQLVWYPFVFTCGLPPIARRLLAAWALRRLRRSPLRVEIGRASCRE